MYANEFSSITSISWNQYDGNYVAIGTQAGDVYLVDKREPGYFLSVLHCFDSGVNKMAFSNATDFAVCGDANDIVIASRSEKGLEAQFRNSSHLGPVKDLKWHNDTFYSCGFGKCLIKSVRQSPSDQVV